MAKLTLYGIGYNSEQDAVNKLGLDSLDELRLIQRRETLHLPFARVPLGKAERKKKALSAAEHSKLDKMTAAFKRNGIRVAKG